jgi:hypothetical protein
MFETILFAAVLAAVYILHGAFAIPMAAAVMTAAALGVAALTVLVRGNKPRAGNLGLKAAVFLGLCLALYGLKALNESKAVRGARTIAAACAEYKAKTGAYPDGLRALVPEYLKDIPAARFTIMWAQYRLVDGRVMYVLEPGLLAAAYDIETGERRVVKAAEMFPGKKE